MVVHTRRTTKWFQGVGDKDETSCLYHRVQVNRTTLKRAKENRLLPKKLLAGKSERVDVSRFEISIVSSSITFQKKEYELRFNNYLLREEIQTCETTRFRRSVSKKKKIVFVDTWK